MLVDDYMPVYDVSDGVATVAQADLATTWAALSAKTASRSAAHAGHVRRCARIGALHSVVLGGCSPDSLAGRIEDCDACAVIGRSARFSRVWNSSIIRVSTGSGSLRVMMTSGTQ